MTYRIRGLDPAGFAPLLAMTNDQLAGHRSVRVRADSDRGFPCRVTLEDAKSGESLILTHFVSHDVTTPYRTAYAIYVRESANVAADFVDRLPPVFDGRSFSLRGFGDNGMLTAARLAPEGKAETQILEMLDDPRIAYIDAHNAAHGCFAARIERHANEVD